MNRMSLLPVLIVTSFYAGVTSVPPVPAVLALLLLSSVLWRARLSAPLSAQMVLSGVAFGLAMFALTTLLPPAPPAMDTLRPGWNAFAGAMLLVTTLRFWVKAPAGGAPTTLGLAVVALTACGGARTGWLYPAVVLAFLASAFLARRAADPGRAPFGALLRRHAVIISVMLAIVGGVAFAIVSALPSAHEWAISRFRMYSIPRTGFADRMWLGSMQGMLLSDRRVLRVRGETDHLRGIVYTDYYNGRWSTGEVDTMRPVALPSAPPATGRVVEVEIIDPEPRRYFFPLFAGRMAASSGSARVDHLGVVAPIAAEPSDRLWFAEPRPDTPRQYAVAPPDPRDLVVPGHIRRQIAPIAQAWTEGLDNDIDKLHALQRHLQHDFGYSLEVAEGHHADPIIDFLVHKHDAYCEYFATAMALLARCLGIPARVAGGYRVHERNELGDYYVVRERNAHTWVEAWVEDAGAWRTFDPTPVSEMMAGQAAVTPLLPAVVDWLGSQWAAFLSWLDKRTWTEMIVAPLTLMLVGFGYRWWRTRKERVATRAAVLDAALPCFEDLSRALEKRGIVRAPAETPLQWAARLDERLDGDLAGRLAQLLARYSALRYGGHGDREALDRDTAALCRELSSLRRS